jgi:hypothetical protein
MTRFLSTILILTLAWTSTIQAFYVDTNTKHASGAPLSDYENRVRTDDRKEGQRYWRQKAGQATAFGVAVAAIPGVALEVPRKCMV